MVRVFVETIVTSIITDSKNHMCCMVLMTTRTCALIVIVRVITVISGILVF